MHGQEMQVLILTYMIIFLNFSLIEEIFIDFNFSGYFFYKQFKPIQQIFYVLINPLSPQVHPTSVHITAVLVDYQTPTNRNNKGVATGWLKNLHPSEPESSPKVPIFIRRSQFRLPSKSQTPVIMIGPGTGLAPFRGFIQERSFMKKEGEGG